MRKDIRLHSVLFDHEQVIISAENKFQLRKLRIKRGTKRLHQIQFV